MQKIRMEGQLLIWPQEKKLSNISPASKNNIFIQNVFFFNISELI
jgi:hypothetical protein